MSLRCQKPGLKPISLKHGNMAAPVEKWGRGRGGRPWRRTREQVFARDKYLCQICLKAGKLTPVELHGPSAGVCDHRIPLSQGGPDTMDNLQTICQPCDTVKTLKESAEAQGYG